MPFFAAFGGGECARCGALDFRAYKCAADGADWKDILFSIFSGVSVGPGTLVRPPLTVCTGLQRRHEVMPPYGSRPVTALPPQPDRPRTDMRGK